MPDVNECIESRVGQKIYQETLPCIMLRALLSYFQRLKWQNVARGSVQGAPAPRVAQGEEGEWISLSQSSSGMVENTSTTKTVLLP